MAGTATSCVRVQFQDRPGLVGLSWSVLPQQASVAALRQAAREFGHDLGVMLPSPPFSGRGAGTLRGIDAGDAPEQLMSLAGAIAEQIRGRVALLPVTHGSTGESLWWMVGADADGIVVGTDIIGSLDAVESELRELLIGRDDLTVCGPKQLLERFPGLAFDILDLAAMAEALRPEHGRVLRLASKVRPFIFAGIGLAGACVVLALVMRLMEGAAPPPPPLPPPPALSAEELARLDLERVQAEQLKAARELMQAESVAWVRDLMQFVYGVPLSEAGFRLTTVSCSTAGACDFRFSKNGPLQIYEFRQRYLRISERIEFSMDGEQAAFRSVLSLRGLRPAGSAAAIDQAYLDAAPELDALRTEWIDRFNQLEWSAVPGWSYSVGAFSQVGGTQLPPDAQMLVAAPFTVSISELWLLDLMLTVLDNPYISINEVGFEVADTDTSVQLRGAILARNTIPPASVLKDPQ